jgi:hypothetical protein
VVVAVVVILDQELAKVAAVLADLEQVLVHQAVEHQLLVLLVPVQQAKVMQVEMVAE